MKQDERHDFFHAEQEKISEQITRLWNHPELPMMEYQSSSILMDWLRQEGFTVEENYCGMPTAFKAYIGEGSPVIGILAEYDALAGLSNDAVPERKPLNQRAGHACLHCHIGAGNTGAAIAAGKYLKEKGLQGSIVVIGCPAEEILWGKVALLGEGGFEGIDILLTSHVDYQNAAVSRPTLSCFSGEFCFGGISSHTGAARAHNALDGAELAVSMLERMRAHQFPGTSVEHVIRSGGDMPNITPDHAALWINVRDAEYEKARQIYGYVQEVVQEAAKIAGVSVVEGFLAGAHGYLPNHVLGQLLYHNLQKTGGFQYSKEDAAWMETLCANAVGCGKIELHPEILYLKEGVDPYSQDDGEASWHMPLGRVNWEIPAQIPLHNWCTTALAGTLMSQKGALMASETLFLSVIDLLQEPVLVLKAKEELKERVKGKEPGAPEYGSFDVLTKYPQTFWDGTWLTGRL